MKNMEAKIDDAVEKFYEMKVPEDKLEYIFHKNAAHLWRMEEEK